MQNLVILGEPNDFFHIKGNALTLDLKQRLGQLRKGLFVPYLQAIKGGRRRKTRFAQNVTK